MIIGNGETISIQLSKIIEDPLNPGDLVFQDELFACDLEEAPDFMWRNPNGK